MLLPCYNEELTIAEVVRRHMEALILVNNRLEGNAPGTIRAVVEMMEQGGKGAG